MRRQESPRYVRGWWLLAVVGGLLYLVAALYQLDLPGLNYDEALDAVPAMQVVLGQPADSHGTLDLGGRRWPIMTMPYVGVTTTYYLVPIFALFGISVWVLRGAAVFLGIVSLLLSWGFLRRFLDERVASLAVLLLALNPSFVFWTRMGAWVQLVLVPITLVAVWSLFAWYQRGRLRHLLVGAFMLGLGLATHLQFAWVWGALILAWLCLSPWLGDRERGPSRFSASLQSRGGSSRLFSIHDWLWPFRRAPGWAWGLAMLVLLIGCAPLILFNLQGLGTFTYTQRVLAEQESGLQHGLAALAGVPALAAGAFETLLSGDWFVSKIGGPYRNPLAVPAFLAACVVVIGLAFRRRLRYRALRIAFLLVFLISVVMLSVIIRSAESAHHLLVLWPIPQAMVAAAFFGLGDAWVVVRREHSAGRAPTGTEAPYGVVMGAAVVLLLVGAEAWTTARYHRSLAQTGGVGHFSDAIYALAADLDRPGAPSAVAMDWGFRRNLQLLTQNRVDVPEWYSFWLPPDEKYEPALSELVRGSGPDTMYLFHPTRWTAFPGHWEILERVAYRQRRQPVPFKTYLQRDGREAITAYTLQPIERTFETPAAQHVLDARLGDEVALLGYDLEKQSVKVGEEVRLTLYWKALEGQGWHGRDYKVFVHLYDDQGKLAAQHDSLPGYGAYPMSQWQAGEVMADRIWLPVPAGVPPGTYHLFVGMYDEATGERLPLTVGGERLKGDTLGLADIIVD